MKEKLNKNEKYVSTLVCMYDNVCVEIQLLTEI